MISRRFYVWGFYLFLSILFLNCKKDTSNKYEWHSIEVTATAYNSLAYQTDSDPSITAFGDSLKPGMKCIAVSKDLLKLGLKHNTMVTIKGLEGTYLVKDKMHSRWRKRIDIYMGTDVKAAKQWGRKKLKIQYRTEIPKISD